MQKAYQINNESGDRSKGRFGATVSVVFAARKPLKIDCSIEGSTYQLPSLSEVQVISHRTHTHSHTGAGQQTQAHVNLNALGNS